VDAFRVHEQLIQDYRSFTEGFVEIQDQRIRQHVEQQAAQGAQWPPPWLALNPAFPEIFAVSGADDPAAGSEGWAGGFSCLLGNPPWERVKLQEQEFFAARDTEIAQAPNKAARQRRIKALLTSESPVDKTLHRAYLDAKHHAEGDSALLRTSGRYPLTGRGDVNTYAVFAETFRALTGPYGRSGVIVPTGIATDATTQYFFRDLVESNSLAALYDFENRAGFFEAVDSRTKFALLTVAGRATFEPAPDFAFFLHDPALIETASFTLTPEEITLLNPNTGTCPVFRSRRDAEITLGIYRRVPVLVKEDDPDGNPWGVKFMTMFHMSNDSHLFHTREDLETDGWYLDGNIFIYGKKRMLPLYQGMMADFFDHRAADVVRSSTAQKRQNQPRYLSPEDHDNPSRVVQSIYWVNERHLPEETSEWLLAFSDITSPTNERSMVPYALPRSAVGNKAPLILSDEPGQLLTCMLANLSSIIFDFTVRQKIGGTTMNYFYVRQFAVLAPSSYRNVAAWSTGEELARWIKSRLLELVYTATDTVSVAADLGDHEEPFRWCDERRMELRAELDAAFLQLYGIDRSDAEYVLETFPIVKRKDEAKYGEYRTKRLILEVYDRMAEAIRTGEPYQTIVDPQPGQGPRHPARQEA